MNKRLLTCLIGLLIAASGIAQSTVIEAKRVKATDSLQLKEKWIKSILIDTALTGATSRDIASADALIKYIANRLAFTVKYGDTAAIVAGYARINRMLDSLSAVQSRIQSKLTKSDADTYYPTAQRLIDSATAIQSRVQSKLTKSDADTYYPAIQRLIDSAAAIQSRVQSKLTKSDADSYYPATQRLIDSASALQSRIQTKQPLLGYTAENAANKATDFTTVNNTLYPTVQAAKSYADGLVAGLLNDRGNYDPSGNAFPSTGGSGTSGAIKKGNIWYITASGLLGSDSVHKGDWIRALVDAPGTTASNWGIVQGNLGYTPENKGNKSVNTSLGTSDNLYPSQNAVKVYVDAAVANGNTAYSWGNHASAGYSTASNTQTFTNKTWNGVAIANAYLANSSVTINGTVFSLGGSGSIINGTGFVKASGTTISYDNSTYLTTSSASSSYVPYTGATALLDLGSYGLRSDFAQFYGGNFSVVRSATTGSATMFFATGNRTAAPVDWSVGSLATTSNFQIYNYGTSHGVVTIDRTTDATTFYGAVAGGGLIQTTVTSTTNPSLQLNYNGSSTYAKHLMNGNGDYVISAPSSNGVTSGNLVLQAAGVSALTINTSQTISTSSKLWVNGATGASTAPFEVWGGANTMVYIAEANSSAITIDAVNHANNVGKILEFQSYGGSSLFGGPVSFAGAGTNAVPIKIAAGTNMGTAGQSSQINFYESSASVVTGYIKNVSEGATRIGMSFGVYNSGAVEGLYIAGDKTVIVGGGSGNALAGGSLDIGKDIGIVATQGIVSSGTRVLSFQDTYSVKVNGTLGVTSTSVFGNDVGLGVFPLSGGGNGRWITTEGSTYSGGIIYSVGGVAKGYTYYDNSDGMRVQGASGVPVILRPNGTTALTLATTGAATFASTVTATAFYESSDLRQKHILSRFHSADGIDAIDYVFKPTGQQKYGYGAQWVQSVLPFAVTKGLDGFLKVDYTSVFTYKLSMLEKRIAQIEKSKK